MNLTSPFIHKQHGVVLFIALIALLVLSLAAVGLIRSVDTNTVIAGNLALKQSALVSSDRGAEAALNWMETTMNTNDQALDSNQITKGYFATFDVNGDGQIDADDDAMALVDTSGIIETGDDGLGNTVSYVIQRMCMQAAPATETNVCMYGDSIVGTGSQGVKPGPLSGAKINSKQSPMYRVTVKVRGPKNTVSYTQTFVY